MILKKLKLTNFRNYLDFEEGFHHLKTIIIGQNAQGKSNILEAINILATSQSDRAEKDSNLVYWNKEYALIFANIKTKEDDLDIALQINSTGRRKLKMNGVAKKAPQADLVGNFFSVMFSCDDLYLIKGSPSIRRNWIDNVLFQLDTKYHKALQNYQKSVVQKNALLKKAQEGNLSRKALKEQLDIWNEQILNFGTEVIYTRINFIADLQPIAKDFQDRISKQTEDLDMIYKSTIQNLALSTQLSAISTETEKQETGDKKQETEDKKIMPHASCLNPQSLRESFKQALDKSFDEELARGQSVIGPHRDDLIFLINKKEAKSFASQGQQRSFVLSIKLAELQIIENRKGEIPVLLLDHVFAELDESRQDFLLHNLPKNIQIFLTTTHLSDVQKEFLQEAQILEVEAGKIKVKHL